MIADRAVIRSGTLLFYRTVPAVRKTCPINMLPTVFVNSPIAKPFTLRTDILILLIIVMELLDRIDPFFITAASIHDWHMRDHFLL